MKKFLILFLLFFSINLVYSAGADLTISASTSWAPGTYDYGTLTINSNSVLTLQGNTTSGTGVIINADNIIIEAGSSISSNGQGYSISGTYRSGTGPGKGIYCGGSGYGGGAGHGGQGGDAYQGVFCLGSTYGNMSHPILIGSSGASAYSTGGRGGGAVKLNVSNTLIIDGTISVNGNPGLTWAGGGSGGSILIIADTISGSGSITSNGGDGQGTRGGAGGGGRIALHYSNYTYSGSITAYGGSLGYEKGGAGTIYTKSSSQPNFNLIINNNNNNAYETYPSNVKSDYVVDNLTIGGFGKLGNLNSLNVTTAINGQLGSDFTLTNGGIRADDDIIFPSTFSNLVLDNFDLTLDILNIPNDLTIKSGSNINRYSGDVSILNISATSIDIQSGGSINLDGQGYSISGTYRSGTGPGKGIYCGGSGYGGGAGHGGLGGDAYQGAFCLGSVYGNMSHPILVGSSGASAYSNGGSGGGAVKLNVSNTLIVDGTISVNGNPGLTWAGGGSGGSILIIADTISGSGSITSNGGDGHGTRGGGGGGGRIALHCSNYSYSGDFFVNGGLLGWDSGGDGTIYQSLTCAGTPNYVSPTPNKNLKLTNQNQFIFNISDMGKIISGCEIDIGGTNYTMTYSNGYCNLTYVPNSTTSISTLEFQGYYESSSVWYPIEKRVINIYPDKNSNQNFDSVGIGSLIISMLIFVLVLFF